MTVLPLEVTWLVSALYLPFTCIPQWHVKNKQHNIVLGYLLMLYELQKLFIITNVSWEGSGRDLFSIAVCPFLER